MSEFCKVMGVFLSIVSGVMFLMMGIIWLVKGFPLDTPAKVILWVGFFFAVGGFAFLWLEYSERGSYIQGQIDRWIVHREKRKQNSAQRRSIAYKKGLENKPYLDEIQIPRPEEKS